MPPFLPSLRVPAGGCCQHCHIPEERTQPEQWPLIGQQRAELGREPSPDFRVACHPNCRGGHTDKSAQGSCPTHQSQCFLLPQEGLAGTEPRWGRRAELLWVPADAPAPCTPLYSPVLYEGLLKQALNPSSCKHRMAQPVRPEAQGRRPGLSKRYCARHLLDKKCNCRARRGHREGGSQGLAHRTMLQWGSQPSATSPASAVPESPSSP